jgi:small subunit ribosomal protein S20
MRQEAVSRARNNGFRASMRAEIKALRAAVDQKDIKTATEKLSTAQSEISKALKKKLIHKNTAARKLASLSRLAKNAGVKVTPATKTATKKPATTKAASPAKTPATKKATKKA